MIIRVDDNLSVAECNSLIELFERHKSATEFKDFLGWPLVQYRNYSAEKESSIVRKALSNAVASLKNRLGVGDQFPEQMLLTGTGVGSYHVAHADNCRQDAKGDWVPNQTPHRTFTCMQYLNEDFDGGELVFPDRNFSVKPRAGMLIAFPADQFHVHRVDVVTSGTRYSLAIWTTVKSDCGMHLD